MQCFRHASHHPGRHFLHAFRPPDLFHDLAEQLRRVIFVPEKSPVQRRQPFLPLRGRQRRKRGNRHITPRMRLQHRKQRLASLGKHCHHQQSYRHHRNRQQHSPRQRILHAAPDNYPQIEQSLLQNRVSERHRENQHAHRASHIHVRRIEELIEPWAQVDQRCDDKARTPSQRSARRKIPPTTNGSQTAASGTSRKTPPAAACEMPRSRTPPSPALPPAMANSASPPTAPIGTLQTPSPSPPAPILPASIQNH